jgi:hypothetical protein
VATKQAIERLEQLGYELNGPVRLTAEGREYYRNRCGVETGRAVSATTQGLLRVALDGSGSIESFHPQFWEHASDPDVE